MDCSVWPSFAIAKCNGTKWGLSTARISLLHFQAWWPGKTINFVYYIFPLCFKVRWTWYPRACISKQLKSALVSTCNSLMTVAPDHYSQRYSGAYCFAETEFTFGQQLRINYAISDCNTCTSELFMRPLSAASLVTTHAQLVCKAVCKFTLIARKRCHSFLNVDCVLVY